MDARLRRVLRRRGERGRLGWANGPVLLYGAGGLAWGQVKTSFDTFGIATTPGNLTAGQLAALQTSASSNNTKVGFAAGAGVEWMAAPNWSVKAQYLYVALMSSQTLNIPGGSAKAGNVPIQVARVGINFFFGR